MIHLETSLRLGRQALQPARIQINPILRHPQEKNPLFAAVTSNDLKEFINLVEAGNPINVLNTKGESLLNAVMRQKRVEMFNYLLTKSVDVNFVNKLGEPPLLYLVKACFDEYFAYELIKKGADIHKTDSSGSTLLHLAAKSNTLQIGELVIQQGGDINARGQFGVTPLYAACEAGNLDWICMLLYYGADITICSNKGVLPLAVIPKKFTPEEVMFVFNHTFDDNTTVSLPSIVAAMVRSSPLFSKILEHVTQIEYNSGDLQDFVNCLPHMQTRDLEMFLDKFGHIVEEMFGRFLILDSLVYMTSCYGSQNVRDLFEVFLRSEYVAGFVQSEMVENPTVSLLFEHLSESLGQEEFSKMIFLLLSYGLTATSRDLDTIYNNYGDCDLFRILLHMDVVMLSSKEPSIAVLYYSPHANIDLLDLNESLCVSLLEYYNHSRLKQFIQSGDSDNELIDRVKKLPGVPLLVELSRNVARKYIVDKFNIQKSMHFNTVLQTLPIGEMNRSIVSLRRKLYCF